MLIIQKVKKKGPMFFPIPLAKNAVTNTSTRAGKKSDVQIPPTDKTLTRNSWKTAHKQRNMVWIRSLGIFPLPVSLIPEDMSLPQTIIRKTRGRDNIA